MIDRGGDFVCAVGGLKSVCVQTRACVFVRNFYLAVLYLFGSTSERLCGHLHIVLSVVSKRGLKLTNMSQIFGCRMTKMLLVRAYVVGWLVIAGVVTL